MTLILHRLKKDCRFQKHWVTGIKAKSVTIIPSTIINLKMTLLINSISFILCVWSWQLIFWGNASLMWLYYYWIALTCFVSNQSFKNLFIKWCGYKFYFNLCHLNKKCLFSWLWLYTCNAPVPFSAYIECNNTKEHGLDQCTTRSFWSGPGSPMWFPSVGQGTPNPPTIPLAFTLKRTQQALFRGWLSSVIVLFVKNHYVERQTGVQ